MLKSPMQDLRSRTQYNLRKDNLNEIIFAHLNINSIRKKFDQLADLIKGKIDVSMISESKIDNSIPDSHFCLAGYSATYRTGTKGPHSAVTRQKKNTKYAVSCLQTYNSATAAFILNLNLTQ